MQTLEQRIDAAMLRIDNGGRKPVIIDFGEDEQDDDSSHDDDEFIMKVYKPRPPSPPRAPSVMPKPTPPSAPPMPAIVEFDAIPVIPTLTAANQNSCRDRALQAELAYKSLPVVELTLDERRVSERIFKASAVINTSLAKVKRVLQWKQADVERENKRRKHALREMKSAHEQQLDALVETYRTELRTLSSQWMTVLEKYSEGIRTVQASLKTQASREIIIALRSILSDSKEKLHSLLATPGADLKTLSGTLSMLHHAITDSMMCTNTIVADLIGTRPEYDEVRHRQMHDALRNTRADIEKVKTEMEVVRKTIQATAGDTQFGAQTRLRSLSTRLEKAETLEAFLAKELCDTEMQRGLKTLSDSAMHASGWYTASVRIADVCKDKVERLQMQHSRLVKQMKIEEGLLLDETQTAIRDLAVEKTELLESLKRDLITELRSVSGLRTHDYSQTQRLAALRNHLHARTAFEYAMLL